MDGSRGAAEAATSSSTDEAPAARIRDACHRLCPRLVVGVVQVASTIAFVLPLDATRGFPLDDAWIHQVVARTFATTGTLGYSAGAFGAGATSYLWATLLAVGHVIGGDPVVFANLLGVAASLAAGQILLSLFADQRGRAPLSAIVPVVAAVAGGDHVWFSVSGMEASLEVALCLGAVAAVAHAARSAARAALAGVLAGAAALVRPDCIPLGALLASFVWWRTRSVRASSNVALPWAVACAAYFAANMALVGKAMPATLSGRRWLWIDSGVGTQGVLQDGLSFLGEWALRLRTFTLHLDTNAALWVVLGLSLYGAFCAAREQRHGLVLAAAWAAVHLGLFFFILPVPGHGGRYQPLVPILVPLFTTLGVHRVARAVARAVRRRARRTGHLHARCIATAALAVWVIALLDGWSGWRRAHRAAVSHIRGTEEAAAVAVRDLGEDARVASFDVGAIGYLASRPVLDLGGLTDPRVVDAMRAGSVVDLLRAERVTHLVIPKGADEYPDLSNFAFRLGLDGDPAGSSASSARGGRTSKRGSTALRTPRTRRSARPSTRSSTRIAMAGRRLARLASGSSTYPVRGRTGSASHACFPRLAPRAHAFGSASTLRLRRRTSVGRSSCRAIHRYAHGLRAQSLISPKCGPSSRAGCTRTCTSRTPSELPWRVFTPWPGSPDDTCRRASA